MLAAPLLHGCSSRPTHATEYFDESTGSTLTAVAAPLVFARSRADVAAFAHDFATLVAVEIDQSGHATPYLLLYRWSTVDPRMWPLPGADQGALRLLADGRVIDMQPLERLPVSLARKRALHVPNHGAMVAHAYRVDPGLLAYIAGSHELSLRLPQERLDVPFTLQEDGRAALARFVAHTAP